VFLVNLVGQRFPTIERREQIPIPDDLIKEVLPVGDYHLEEERRLFYVGMTRTKDQLFFTAADYYGEGKREKKLSPFIFEALGDTAIAAELPTINHQQLTFLDYKVPDQLTVNSKQLTALHIDYLSYSQIETFKTCPLHYKLKYIFKVPTAPSASQSFGTSIHAALRNFYAEIKDGQKPTEKLLLNLLEKNWVKEGFESRSHEKKFFEKGKDYLRGYLNVGYNPKVSPVLLEQPFVIPLSNIYSSPSNKPLKIGGRFDRVDVNPDGSIEIVDYKTGAKIPSQKEVDDNLQLSFYALAATKINSEPFGKKPEKVKLSLYFLDEQEKLTTTRTEKQLEKAARQIFEVREEIEKSDFACSGNMLCKNCEYSLLCRSEE
jgi:DNA helicase-2/ATP-dependent DNA helicase PcrA